MSDSSGAQNPNLPIGVFDSGVGGLTVLKALLDSFPRENFLYLGDTARLPYGTKSPETIRKYSEQALHFLHRQGVKTVVIACNSASSQFREKEFEGMPVINVIEPGARAALNTSLGRLGILGTQATVGSKVYESTLLEMASLQQREIAVFAATAGLFVPLAEEGWVDDPITNLIAYRYVLPLMDKQIDTLILGCTHYPILRNSIARALGAGVTLVESGPAVASELQEKFASGMLSPRTQTEPRFLRLISTDQTPHFEKISQQLLQPHEITSVATGDL
jgi:glutamate racemase